MKMAELLIIHLLTLLHSQMSKLHAILDFPSAIGLNRILQKYFGRARNCYTITLRVAHRALRYATQDRPLKEMTKRRVSMSELYHISSAIRWGFP